MEKTTKRLLGLAIALVLVLGMIPVSQIEVKADHVVNLETVNDSILDADGNVIATNCPACGAENVTWIDVSELTLPSTNTLAAENIHCYVKTATKSGAPARFGLPTGDYTLCLHTGVSRDRIYSQIIVRSGNTVNIFGDGEIQTYYQKKVNNVLTYQGQTILNNVGGADVRIYGGQIIGKGSAESPVPNSGDAIYMSGTEANPNTLLITGTAIVRNGYSTQAGALVHTKYTDITVSGSASLYGGNSSGTGGGNLYISYSSLTMSGGQIYGGKATGSSKSGGNLYITDNSELIMEGGKIYGGECTNAGGNVYLFANSNSSLTMSGGQIYGGKSAASNKYGGIFAPDGTSFEITGGYLAGHADDPEQNIIYTRVGGTISGATIGKLADNTELSGKIGLQTGTLTLNGAELVDVTVNALKDGAVVRLDGATNIPNGSKVQLCADTDAALEVVNTFTGSAYVYDERQELGRYAYGTVLENVTAVAKNAQTGAYEPSDAGFTGEVLWNEYEAIIGSANIVVTADTTDAVGTVAVGDVQVREQATGDLLTWQSGVAGVDYTTNYIKLATAQNLVLNNEDVIVDINGQIVTANGTGSLSVLNTNTKKDGTVALGDEADIDLVRDVTMAGNRYVVIDNDDGTASPHAISMQLTSVALSTANAGYYYKAQYTFDDVVAGSIDSYGIAASAQDMPGADFSTEKNGDEYVNAWTTETKALTSGAEVNGHGIVDVLKEGEDNDTRGKTKIYAAPYIVINVSSTETVTLIATKEVAISLYDILVAIDENWDAYASAQETVQNFVSDARWANDISAWEFTNIQ